MGNGSGKRIKPTALRGYRREVSSREIPLKANISSDKDATNGAIQEESVQVEASNVVPETKDTHSNEKEASIVVQETKDTNSNEKPEYTPEERKNVHLTEEDSHDLNNDSDFIKTIYGRCSSVWSTRCLGKLDFNINAYHGGCTALYFVSCLYGKEGKGAAELDMIRSGFDCNQYALKTFKNGKFGGLNYHFADEDGMFVADCEFGTNDLMVLTNDCRFGNLRNGVFVEIAEGGNTVVFPLNVNGALTEFGCGLTLILASGIDGKTSFNATYVVRSESFSNKYKANLLSGEDKFKFGVTEEGMLTAEGPTGSRFSLFHNRDNLSKGALHCLVRQTQAINGDEKTMLVDKELTHAAILVLCSNSNGTEDSTVSAVYHISFANGNIVSSTEICGSNGPAYTTSNLWSFEVVGGKLFVSGPTGPCKYGVLTNIQSSRAELTKTITQTTCIATGESDKTLGDVNVSFENITGYVSKLSEICIMMNEKIIQTIQTGDIQKNKDRFTFVYQWKEEEKVVGYHMIRVFATRKHTKTGDDIFIELKGSPFALTRQKPGVIYALNCAGPCYQDHNDIVYASEHKLFASFSAEWANGHRSKILGGVKPHAKLPGSMLKSHDGFLYANTRSTHNESNDYENQFRFCYQIGDMPNGKFKLRLHLINIVKDMIVNGKRVSATIQEEIKKMKKHGELSGPTCYCVDIDIEITDHQLVIFSQSPELYKHADYLGAFALLDKSSYKDNVKSNSELKEMEDEKRSLVDNFIPIIINSTRKAMTIVGWSPNLLKNASGENMDMMYWNTQGDFKISQSTGYGTETMFTASHMWCEKYQEVNLLDSFTAEYLDMSPDIQVSEMYKEGHCGGGFYKMTIQLLSGDGDVIKEYATGQIGTITLKGWLEAGLIFSDYGPGVRIVAFTSAGKDDKYWAGYFGPFICAAQVRVRMESKATEGDSFTDIVQGDSSARKSELEKIVSRILTDNKQLSEEFVQEESIPIDKEFEKQIKLPSAKVDTKRKKLKKREIRVFVSSTFRDFNREREEIIKKAFREVNQMCQDRDVFFTYVDLRWGITSEQTDDGKTISICLQEIDKCRPYFICLMGDRFGWCQTKDKVDNILNQTYDYAIENIPNLKWIEEYRFDTSVTQLEVLHGVLNHSDAPTDKCFFYLRDTPSKEDFTEDEYKRMICESEWHNLRQTELKSRVKNFPGLNIKTFKTANEVAETIKKDLEQSIDKDFPKGTELTKLEQQREAHNAFASARCRVYIGRQDYFTEINSHREQNIAMPFIILGESGCGKSALVANWTKQIEDAEPDTFLFIHFIGSSAESADYIKMIRRLYEEMKDTFKFDMEIPSSDSLLIHEMDKWLRMAGSLAKVVVVFDALNQLDDGSGDLEGSEHELQWIPKNIPPNVFLLVSTLPGKAMNSCIEAGWPSMKVDPLQDSQKMQIITDYLEGIYGKSLNTEQKEMIVSVKQTSNPLYLKSLLDEVRMYGSFRTLTDKIMEYLAAETPQDLFAKILERLEDDFDTTRANLVKDSTTALWCSNRGMSESELVEFLDIPSAVWSPFYLSLYENLVNRNGILNFFHDHLRQAVEKKYLSTEDLKRQCYLKLADFYEGRETTNRTVEELPFLLTRAGELERLKVTVSNLDVFYRLTGNEDGIFELIKAWNRLGGFALSGDAYMTELSKVTKDVIMKDPEYYCKLYSQLGKFFLTVGLMEAAKNIYKTLIKQLELNYGESHGTIVYDAFGQKWNYRCKHPDVIQALHELGTVYNQLGEHQQAIIVDNDAINRQNRIQTPTEMLQLCEGFLGLSAVYLQMEDMMEAKKLMTRALELATFVLGKRHHFVAAILTKLGQLSYKQGRVDEALAYYIQDLKVIRSEVGTNHPRAATVLNEIGLVYDDKHNEMAQKIYEAALSIILETYGNDYLGTGTMRYNLGAFYFGKKYFLKAKYQFTESYRIHQMFLAEDHADIKAVKQALDTVTKMTE